MTGGITARARLASQVIKGKDNCLFHRDQQAIGQLSGALRFSDKELLIWKNTLETRHAWCKANGIEFRFMIVPEKHVVYKDKLPKGIFLSDDRLAMQLLSALSDNVRKDCFYPVKELQDGRSERASYLQTDTHWSMHGGYIGYKILMDSLIDRFPDIDIIQPDNLSYQPTPYIGDLGVRLEPEIEEFMDVVSHIKSLSWNKLFDNKIFARGAMAAYSSERIDYSLNCLLIRDSFSNYIIPHMIPTFKNLTTLSSINIHYDLIRKIKPDVVILQMAERFLGNFESYARVLPNDLSSETIEEFTSIP